MKNLSDYHIVPVTIQAVWIEHDTMLYENNSITLEITDNIENNTYNINLDNYGWLHEYIKCNYNLNISNFNLKELNIIGSELYAIFDKKDGVIECFGEDIESKRLNKITKMDQSNRISHHV